MWQQSSRFHPGRFDFHHNTSSSLAPIRSLGSPPWPTHSTSPLTHSTSPPTQSTSPHLTHSTSHLCKPEGYSAWVSADRPLVEAWGWIILGRHSVSDEERPVGWTQPDLLPCADVGLVILNDDGLTPACQARWHRSLGVTRDNWSWRMYASGTVLERLRAR